ncbi:hypothetical protein HBI68_247180 [Parastagonospora nodorum]|nr:hypothetical protein HBI68_247180 [Parastagonospora nodorum]KAH6380597.1 hypothetical protein HBI08_234780 [Parastagonospora nodorum]KAH6384010.1 hypothetical protein HBI60_251000 [Parastagonospora nodorum]
MSLMAFLTPGLPELHTPTTVTGKKRGRPRKDTTTDTLEPKAKVLRLSETKIVETNAGPLQPKAKAVQGCEAKVVEASPPKPKEDLVQKSRAEAMIGEAGPSKPKSVAQMVPQVKKIKVVPKPWKAPEARMF